MSACGLLLAILLPVAHPLHTSAAEIVLDARTREVVVTIRVFADDLQTAAGRTTGDVEIASWLRRGFVLRDAGGRALDLRLTARKRVADMVHFTLRAPARAGLAGLRVHHALFFERFADQVNLVRVRQGRRTATLLFTPGGGPAALQ